MSPIGVSIMTPVDSGIEWVIPKNLIFYPSAIGKKPVFPSTTFIFNSGK
jgi:hypothetical protein